MREHWRRLAVGTQQRFLAALQQGLAAGESNQKIATRLVGGTIDGIKVTGVLDTTRRNAFTLARTATAAVSANTRLALYKANPDMIKAIQQVSTLDSRTSDICISYAGQVWDSQTLEPIEGSELPFAGGVPRHYNCRSTLVPVLKSFDELGLPPLTFGKGTRASMDGQVPGDITFDKWLRGKSEKFQDDLLGPARAKMWREGKIRLQQLVDSRGRSLTLAQLEQVKGIGPPKPPRAAPKAAPKEAEIPTFKNKKAAEDWLLQNAINPESKYRQHLGAAVRLGSTFESDIQRTTAQVSLMLRDRFGMKLPNYIGSREQHPQFRFKKSRAIASVHMDSDSLMFSSWASRAKGLDELESAARADAKLKAEGGDPILKKFLDEARERYPDDVALIRALEAANEDGLVWTVRPRFGPDDDGGLAAWWNTMVHEGGHRMHLQDRNTVDGIVNNILFGEHAAKAAMWKRQTSKYAVQDQYEFFAEQFTRYMNGQPERVHPDLLRYFRSRDKGGEFGYPGAPPLPGGAKPVARAARPEVGVDGVFAGLYKGKRNIYRATGSGATMTVERWSDAKGVWQKLKQGSDEHRNVSNWAAYKGFNRP